MISKLAKRILHLLEMFTGMKSGTHKINPLYFGIKQDYRTWAIHCLILDGEWLVF